MYARTATFLATLAAAAGLACAAGAAELRPAVTVTGTAVTLGDLFDDAGSAAGVVVANAPAPGVRSEISVSRVSLAARRNGIDWRNDAGLSHVVVARSGTPVPDEDVAGAIAAAISAQSSAMPSASTLQVDFTNGMAGIQVADGADLTVNVEQLAFNRRNGSFTAILRAPAGDVLSPLHRVTGRAYPVAEVPVLVRDMQPGDVVRQSDIDWVRLPANRIGQNVITSLDGLLGMSPRQPARAGEPMRVSDMTPPLVVEKGAQVDMLLTSGALTLIARGRALESGAVGDVVNVLNIRSNRTIQGVIEGPNMIRVDAPGAARAAHLARAASNS
ncbi:flagellar basal body P-ring formation chaperone FlgA [Parvibaculum sp.]|jgi:flagella basal body P-ring formation protein FlgA|uniref:flagellar basal body P-ring formation chaperone FlgA n=3 Tax=Parvibaculum sp. TaxID=2024848 RepID=UPI001B1E9D6A|nr:flagellar basal body P-ring formation chaperone FlgA [Parvibaculum sp.]MBO6679893.1 flagellar basal body P-ring formation protein FlgA [Parvibaculum sp.]MBO6684351.1 flagellar basal body P-ring formation protein FlgA [Parvibaculum sp.]MBO6903641.1 flagellar basal body P-ring formation protein FlgA [Parvibaculum sp.]